MNQEHNTLTRRAALLGVLQGGIATIVAVPALAQFVPSLPAPQIDPEFITENDYPFFGYEPVALA